jgi:hypothetical protein
MRRRRRKLFDATAVRGGVVDGRAEGLDPVQAKRWARSRDADALMLEGAGKPRFYLRGPESGCFEPVDRRRYSRAIAAAAGRKVDV